MEALALMLIHMLTPNGLTWTRNGVPKTDAAHNRLKREKAGARPEELCRGLPDVFEDFLRYCRRLKFAERPDYDQWREAFMDLAVESGFPEDDAFVWPPPQPEVRRLGYRNHVGADGLLSCSLPFGSRQLLQRPRCRPPGRTWKAS